jgi:hypothetical protein
LRSVPCSPVPPPSHLLTSLSLTTTNPSHTITLLSQRCWNFKLETESTISFKRDVAGNDCPTSTSTGGTIVAGSITNFVDNVPKHLQPQCNNTDGPSLPDVLIASGGPNPDNSAVWFTRTSLISSTGAANSRASQVCFSSVAEAGAGAWNAVTLNAQGGGNGCVVLKPAFRIGLMSFMSVTSGSCPAWSDGSATAAPAVFRSPPPFNPDTAAGEQAARKNNGVPTEVKDVSVVQYAISLSYSANTLNTFAVADPCVATLLRQQAAAGLPSTTADGVYITSITENGVTLPLYPDSPANSFSVPPPFCAINRRMLRDETAVSGRALSNTLSVGLQVVVPPNTNANSFATTVSNTQPANIAGVSAALSGSVTTATVPLAVPVTYPPRVKPYIPDPLIDFFHAIPRFALMGDAVPTNSFSPDMTYLQGAIFPAAGIIALAIIALILYTLAYICGCCACACCKCRRKRDPALYQNGWRKKCGTPRAFAFFALINIALILSVIGYLGRFADGIQTLADAADDFIGVLSTSGDLLSSSSSVTVGGVSISSVATSTTSAASAANSAITTCNSQCAQAVDQILQAVKDGANTASSTASSIGGILSNLAGALGDARAGVDVESLKSQATMAGYAVLGLLALMLTAFSLSALGKNRVASCFFKILAPFNILLITLLIILAGVYYALGIIGADVCAAPANTLLTLTDSAGMGSGLPAETLRYYLQCGPNPATAPGGAYKLIFDNVATVEGAAQQVTSLKTQIDATPNDPAFHGLGATTYPATMAAGMNNAKTALTALKDTALACSSIDPIISQIFEGLCNDGIATIIGMFRILIAASVLLIIQLGIGVDVCCFHPGDPSRWMDGSDDKSAKVMGTAPGPGGVAVGEGEFSVNAPSGIPKASAHQTSV